MMAYLFSLFFSPPLHSGYKASLLYFSAGLHNGRSASGAPWTILLQFKTIQKLPQVRLRKRGRQTSLVGRSRGGRDGLRRLRQRIQRGRIYYRLGTGNSQAISSQAVGHFLFLKWLTVK